MGVDSSVVEQKLTLVVLVVLTQLITKPSDGKGGWGCYFA